jgi:hypothetical protein
VYLAPPTTPDTPEPESTSPASSVSPQTLVDTIDDNVKIVSHDTYPGLWIMEQAALDFYYVWLFRLSWFSASSLYFAS